MEGRLVITHADSIAHARLVVRDQPVTGTWVFDPTLYERAVDAGLPAVEVIAPKPVTDHRTLLGCARQQAFALEAELDRLLQSVAPGPSLLGWQHVNLNYQITATRWYAELWDGQLGLFAGSLPHLFLSDNPAHYYWPSFGPALQLAHRLRGAGIDFKAYTYGGRPDLSPMVPALFDAPDDGPQPTLLTHLPTTFYDKGYFLDEVRASGHRAMNLQSRIWNVDFPMDADVPVATVDQALALLDPADLDRIDTFHALAAQHLETWLAAPIPSPEHRRRQARHIADGYRSQLVTLRLLERRFARQRPARVLISDHDAGFHGPILSFAKAHAIPVVMVPHSKFTPEFEFPGDQITCLTHPLQADTLSDAHGRRVRQYRLAYPETFRGASAPSGELRTVGLLLNGLSLNGVQFTGFEAYIAGVRRIAGWCRDQGLALKLRGRPGDPMTTAMAEATGLSRQTLAEGLSESLADFAASVDICLMYDAPTSADLEFLRNGVALLNPVPEPLYCAEAMQANASVVPRDDVEATLHRLGDLASDPVRLTEFRRQQFIAYVGLFASAQPLRHFL